MSLEKESVKAVVAMVPVAVDLISQLIGVVKQARSENIYVPDIDRLRELNRQLSELDDLEIGSPPDVPGILPELPPSEGG